MKFPKLLRTLNMFKAVIVQVAMFSLVLATDNHHIGDLQLFSFDGLGCTGQYDSARFARLDRVCEECYQLYKQPEIHTACRTNCFNNDDIWLCVEALTQKQEKERLKEMIEYLNGTKN